MPDTAAPLISIVCCTHNRVQFVRTHLAALRPQLVDGVELIYALDNCTDGSFEFLQEAAQGLPQVRVHEHRGEKGLFNCRNFGLSHARGQFVHFLDDDDGVEPGFYAQLCTALARPENRDVDIYLSRLRISLPDGSQSEREVVSPACARQGQTLGHELHLRGDLFRAILDAQLYFNGANALFSRALLTRYGYRQELKKSADWLFNLESALRGPLHIVYSPEVAADYFVHSASMSLGPDKVGWNAKVFDILLTLAAEHPEHLAAVRAACARANFDAGYCLRLTDRARARQHYGRAFQLGLRGKSLLAMVKLALGR